MTSPVATVALHHRTTYSFGHPVVLAPHSVRLRPSPHCPVPILKYELSVDPRDADVGSILAWGFAPYSGGCISYIDLFWGTKKFVEEADRLADQYGDRFRPNKLLREMAKTNQSFYERFGTKKAA